MTAALFAWQRNVKNHGDEIKLQNAEFSKRYISMWGHDRSNQIHSVNICIPNREIAIVCIVISKFVKILQIADSSSSKVTIRMIYMW